MVGRTKRGKCSIGESKGGKNSPNIDLVGPFVDSHPIVFALGNSVAQPVGHVLLLAIVCGVVERDVGKSCGWANLLQ